MKTCLSLTSLAAFSLLWLSSAQNTTAAGLTPAPTSANNTAGSLKSQAQVETATAVGTITSTGNAKVTLTSANIDAGTPLVFLVAVTSGDTSSVWAGKVRSALSADLQVAELFEVGGTGSAITLKRKAQLEGEGVSYYAANDSTLNLALDNDTATGITTATSSEDTTAGFLASTAQVETATADGTITNAGNARVIVTAAGLPGSPKAYTVPVLLNDAASAWATKVRTALIADSSLTSLYDVGVSGTSITLSRKKVSIVSGKDIFAVNDPTLNINIDNNTCAGIIPQSISSNTTAGTLQNAGQVETATALGAVTTPGDLQVVVTSDTLLQKPSTTPLEINGKWTAKKLIEVPVLAGDSTSAWAVKVRTALNADADVSNLFTASGTGSKIVLSRKAENVSPGLSIFADNDPTLNLALVTGSKGILPKLTSTNTTAGELASVAQVEIATAAGTINTDGTLEVVVTAAGLPGSPKSINVPVLAGDAATNWAAKLRTALNADSDITNLFVVGGAGESITLTSKLLVKLDGVDIYPVNDPTLNIALVIDSDGDNLSNFDEIYVHNTNPNNTDTDDDGFADAEEVNSVPPTDPNDYTSKPASLTYENPHNIPNPRNEPQSISITGTFAPFGQRPNTDKTSEDGSAAIRDQNGVIIWVDNRGNAVRVPNSSLAKTLYVSNTECVVWQNRFDGTFNQRGSKSQIVVHRRTADGALTSSPFITIDGTVLETSSVSPSTYGFTLVASSRFDDGNESRQRFVSGADENGNPRYEVRDVDQWDGLNYTIYRITWDDKLQTLSNRAVNVPKAGNSNLGNTLVLGNGSDGSFFFTNILARDFYDDVDDEDPGVFKSQLASFWVTTTQDKEGIDLVGDWAKPTISAPYVTNTRIILETSVLDANEEATGAVTLRDLRIQANGNRFEAASRDLDFGDNVLPVSNYTRDGMPAYIYTINAANTGIKLYRLDAELVRLGGMVTLPAPVVRGNPYVRDPRDASLLIKTEGAGLAWVPAAKRWQTGELIGLARPRLLPNSSQAMPLFVSATEAVGWMNAAAPVDLANGGVVPVAELTHFAINDLNKLVTKNLVPPIVGRYVALTPSLSPDAENEGWYISTFERESTRVALMRTYRLRTANDADGDADGLLDKEEDDLLTEADNPDTDADSISDGREIYPFYLITGSLTYEQARMEAIRRGGRLAVLDTSAKRTAIERLFGNLPIGAQYWLGGSDMDGPKDTAGTREGEYRWMDETGRFFDDAGNIIPSLANIDTTPAAGLFSIGQPNNNGNADGLVLRQDYKWAMAPLTRRYGYIFEYSQSNPKLADSDSDELSDLEEYELGTNPKLIDTDDDGISDYLEVRGYSWVDTAFVLNLENGFKSNPRSKDSDGDGLTDNEESKRSPATNPSLADTDADGLTDSEEVNGLGSTTYTSNPLDPDTDGDGFTDYDEITSTPASNPNDSASRPQPGQLTPANPDLHDQVQLVREQNNLAIPSAFAPFGNRTDYNRFGDDGSAILLDVNGVLLWQDAKGVARTIPNSEFAIPLMVSGSEAIIWTNAFDPKRLLSSDDASGDSQSIKVAVYRINSATGQIGTPTVLPIEGQDILPTAPITTSSQAYTLVSFKHFGVTDDEVASGTYAYVYRLTYAGNAQLLSVIRIPNGDNYLTAIQNVQAMGHGSDGSAVFSVDATAWFSYNGNSNGDSDYGSEPNQFGRIGDLRAAHRRIFSVNGSLPGPSGVVQELSAGTRVVNLGDGGLPPRALYTSATRVVYQTVENGQIKDARRSPSNGALVSDSNFATPLGVGNFLRSTTQTLEGNTSWIYATTSDGLKLRAYRLINTGLEFAYEALLPPGYSLDSAALVSKINPLDGSAVISPNNVDLLWIFDNKTQGVSNAVRIPKSTNARAAYVKYNELVVWGNARGGINSNGSMPDVQVRHYEQKDGKIVNPTNAYTDLSAKIDGRYLLDTVPFTPDFSQWVLNTVEKASPTTARIRSYLLVRYKDLDTDGDGIPDIIEVQPAVGASPFNQDTDGDTLLDGDELYPYAIIEGSFTWDEAKADAFMRGGRLAVIQNRDDYTAVRNRYKSTLAFDVWLGASDKATEGTWVWENGILLNTTKWFEASPFASWADYYSGTSKTREPWATGKPDNLNNGDGLVMRPDGSFEDRTVGTKLSYLIEYARTNPKVVDGPGDADGDGISNSDELAYGTDPLKPDTDGDGVNDYRELAILFTNPNDGSFVASTGGVAVSFGEGRGKYEGLLYNSNDGLGFKLTLNVTNKGAFSGSLGGNFGSAPLRGKFMGDGTWSGRITQGNAGFLRMKLAEQDDGSYGVQGSLETPTGGIYYYQARRAIGFPARKLTSEASAIDDAAGPTGSAVATGGIGKGGKVTQQIYNPDGSRATYAGSVLEGEFMALYARTKGGVPTVMLGNVALRNNSDGKSNFDGIVRLFNRNYDQERSLSGAYYSPPTMGTLPLPAMSLTANNAVFSWSDGRFDGVNKVASWMPNKVTVPTTQNDKATPVYDRKTGLLKLTYTRTDPAKGLINAQSNAFAVVVQGKDKLSGFYTGAGSWGGFSVQENSAGLQPDFTNISPLNKTVSAGSISYNVDVTSSGDWTVDTTGASWVTASVKSGTGSGTVVITVNANASNARREASIRIAGFTHTITQSYR